MRVSNGFDNWFADLGLLYKARYGQEASGLDKNAWKEYFDDDYSPQDALDEEGQYG